MIRKILINTLTILNKVLPKKNKIVFHSFPDFSDNSRAIYDYIIQR